MRQPRPKSDQPGPTPMSSMQPLLQPLLLGSFASGLLWLEKQRPLRSQVENKFKHDLRNTLIAALSGLSIRAMEKPLTSRCTQLVEQKRLGLAPRLPLPRWAQTTLSILLLDYTLYLWHMLTHKTRFLWRFHEVHHEDLDLSASTAVRFHFFEMAISALWRSAQVLAIGVSQQALRLWQTLTLLEILFHHSNIDLPVKWERRLNRIIVTPRMHAIHHSTLRNETNSNWSSGLTIWDWLHGTLKRGVPQNRIRIGVPAYGSHDDLKFQQLLKKPFQRQRESWAENQQTFKIKRSQAVDPEPLSARQVLFNLL